MGTEEERVTRRHKDAEGGEVFGGCWLRRWRMLAAFVGLLRAADLDGDLRDQVATVVGAVEPRDARHCLTGF